MKARIFSLLKDIAKPHMVVSVLILAGLLAISWGFFFYPRVEIFLVNPIIVVEEHNYIIGEITAYNAVVGQTDSTPLIAADGYPVGPDMAACPAWLEFGAKIEINGQEYVCRDRMNIRYRHGNYFDILVDDYQEARNFGRQTLKVVIVKK